MIAFVIGTEVVGGRTYKLLSSSELELLDEELDKDNEDEDSSENLEEGSAIDPSAIVNSFLGTDFKRSQVCL